MSHSKVQRDANHNTEGTHATLVNVRRLSHFRGFCETIARPTGGLWSKHLAGTTRSAIRCDHIPKESCSSSSSSSRGPGFHAVNAGPLKQPWRSLSWADDDAIVGNVLGDPGNSSVRGNDVFCSQCRGTFHRHLTGKVSPLCAPLTLPRNPENCVFSGKLLS